MSYSLSVRAATKAAALAEVIAKLDEVVKQQPVHAADRQQAEAAATVMVTVVPEPTDAQDVSVSVSGSVGWSGAYPDSHKLTSASISVYASLVAKDAPK